MSKLDVCSRTREAIAKGGGTLCETCGWDVREHRSERDFDKAEIERMKAEMAEDHGRLLDQSHQIARLRAELADAEAANTGANKEIARLHGWVRDLQTGLFVNCVYCGHRYGPGDHAAAAPGAPPTMAAALTKHVETCPKHPLAVARALLVRWLDWPGRANDEPDPIEIETAAFLGHKPDCERVEYGVCTCGLAPAAPEVPR